MENSKTQYLGVLPKPTSHHTDCHHVLGLKIKDPVSWLFDLFGIPTWMSQEVSRRLGSVGYYPNMPHL